MTSFFITVVAPPPSEFVNQALDVYYIRFQSLKKLIFIRKY